MASDIPEENPNKMAPFRVLSLDGGGMRGLYTATLLDTLVQRMSLGLNGKPGDVGRSFELICGTSTGSILACALACGISLAQVQEFYSERGPKIFIDPYPRKAGKWKTLCWLSKHLSKPAADARQFKMALSDMFGKTTLGEVHERRGIALCVPAVYASNLRTVVFKTPHLPHLNRDKVYSLVDICMASSAAPIQLPLHKFTQAPDQDKDEVFIDGGLWANSPVLVGLVEALSMAGGRPIRIISVGTCDEPSGDPSVLSDQQWGLARWKAGLGILEASLSAQAAGHLHITRLLINALNAKGHDIRMLRLKETPKASDYFSAIGLDRADQRALTTLRTLANSDVNEITSDMRRGSDPDIKFAADIFSTIKPFEKEK
jgi:uncharacterized protein